MKKKILKLRSEGMSYRNISKVTGMSVGAVAWHINNPEVTRGRGETKKECIRLRKKGMTMQSISDKLGISVNTVYFHCHHLGVKIDRQPERRNEIIRLAKLGFDSNLISLNMGIKKSSVYHIMYKSGVRSRRWEYDNTESVEMCKGLFIDGYSNEEISMMTGLRVSDVIEYTKRCKVYKIKRPVGRPIKPKVMKIKKKEVKSTPLAIDQRAVLGQGISAGVYTKEVKLRDNRDDGRLVNLLYSDLTYKPSISASIRVRDESISDELAVERWAKENGKKSWRVVS